MKTSDSSIWSSLFGTVLWIALGAFAFFYYPMTSVFHEPTPHRIAIASAFFACVLGGTLFSWIEPKSRLASEMLGRGLGWLGMILLLWYR